MKNFTLKNARPLFEALSLALDKTKDLNIGGEVNYCLARNFKRLKPGLDSFNESYDLLIKSFAEKDESGNPIIVNGAYKISDVSGFNDKVSELLDEPFDFEPYKINRSDETDKLPAVVLTELLDIIIIE